MDSGFFVVVARCKVKAPNGAMVQCWSAAPLDPVRGWPATKGDTIEAAVGAQREEYINRAELNESAPELVMANCGPMASGKITRFVRI